jgi:glycosyltransferase involved in cell wall biosynthesis
MVNYSVMKKVLHILEAVEGGAWRHLRDLITSIHGRRYLFEVVLSFEREGGTPDEIRAFLASENVRLYEMPMQRSAAPADMAAVLKLTKLVRRLGPDLIHAHCAKAGILGRVAAKLGAVPSVYTPHCFPFLMKSERLTHVYEAIEKGVVSITSAIIVISREEQAAARQLGYPENRIHLIPNGIAFSGMDLPEYCDNGALQIGFFGRAGGQKGGDTFVRLVEELNRRGVNSQGVMYGYDGSDCRRSNESGTGDFVQVYENCPQDQVIERMRALDVIVMPSRWEGLPYVLLEALDAGVPLSAYRVGGIPDVVAHGVSAMLAEPDDFELLVANTASLRAAGVRR